MSSGCTVCVCGFPADLPPGRVIDKLTIHFQRMRNGGGEIADVEFAPESPDCALVTFEEAAVAQRVLKTDKQVLAVGGKSYPLRVGPYTPGLDPNEVFVYVSMKIDYGRVLGGKEILQSLCQHYRDVAFSFHPQETTCLAKGSFTELQAFSSELLRGFQSQPRNSTPGEVSGPGRRSPADKAACGHGSPLQSVPKSPAEERSQGAARVGPPPRRAKGNLAEDVSLVMDFDVYLYMRKFCQKELSGILLQHQVVMVDVSSDGIATLYLQTAARGPAGDTALASARLALSGLSQKLEASLRKEKISQRELGGSEGARELLGVLQNLCPRLLCHQDEEHLSLIGHRLDVSLARQCVQSCLAARAATRAQQQPAVPQEGSEERHPRPVGHVPRAASLPRRGSLPRGLGGKVGCKLATQFNVSDASTSLPPVPLGGLLPGDPSQTADRHPTETRSHSLLAALAPESGAPAQQPVGTLSRSPLPSSGAQRSLDSDHPLPLGAPSRSFGLVGAVGTADARVSDLERSSTSWFPKSQGCRDSVDKLLPVAPIPAGHLQQAPREESPPLLQQEVPPEGRGQEAGLPVPQQHPLSSTLLAAQGEGVSGEGPWPAQEAGVPAGPPDPLSQHFGYSELALEGPEDEALADLCSLLEASHSGVAISREKHRLGLSYPREAERQVLEALRCFSAQRVALISEELRAYNAQQGNIQEDPSETGKGSI
ncbi:uncharacterized protein LOC143826342 [Paroedura picta]|uniref:uncharacterized protein LOC143826342 n=1 Tax=Paroedura picta TaxID=143630 RepID=UPI004056C3AB